MESHLLLRGVLKGHEGWVTTVAASAEKPNMLLSGSRDKKLIVWNLTRDATNYGVPHRALHGHSHFIQDVVISSDGQFALSASWDTTLRLWDLNAGKTTRRFESHSKDVLSVAFSVDNRQIVSGARDRCVKLWNTLGQCKYTMEDGNHTEWVSCVRFSPNVAKPLVVSTGWDKLVKIWDLTTCKLATNLVGHTGPVYTCAISPDGSICASGGKDGTAMLWDLNEGKFLYSLEGAEPVNALAFSPNRYWLAGATEGALKLWDLEHRELIQVVDQSFPDFQPQSRNTACLSLAWSHDGKFLYAGYADNAIRIYEVATHKEPQLLQQQ